MRHTNILILLAAALVSACTGAPRTIEYPLIRAASPEYNDIWKVELTDSATLVTVHTNYSGRDISWSTDTKIIAGGREYGIKGGIGMTPGEEISFDNGRDATYTLVFDPIPFNTKTIDISESREEGYFNLYGVDLTGRAKEVQDKRLPAAKVLEKIPEFNPGIDSSTVRIHILNWRPGMRTGLYLLVSPKMGDGEEKRLFIDENGYVEYSFAQTGTSNVKVLYPATSAGANGLVDPGETVDFYMDMNCTGHIAMSISGRPDVPDRGVRYSAWTGRHAALSEIARMKIDPREFVKDSGISAEEYCSSLIGFYDRELARINGLDVDETVREVYIQQLKAATLEYADNCKLILWHVCRLEGGDCSDMDAFAKTGRDDIERVYRAVSPVDFDLMEKLAFDQINFHVVKQYLCWLNIFDEGDDAYEWDRAQEYSRKAIDADLTDEDFAVIDSFSNDFYKKTLRYLQDAASVKLAGEEKTYLTVEEWPGAASWMESILAPHKGKVVLVDVWNTWCTPCRSALEITEPEKSGELSSDDIVWIYIANESSPILEYMETIKGIRGIHYRLTKEQWKDFVNHFNVDGIPFYFLAGRDGICNARPDLRDHELFKQELKRQES